MRQKILGEALHIQLIYFNLFHFEEENSKYATERISERFERFKECNNTIKGLIGEKLQIKIHTVGSNPFIFLDSFR